VVKHASSPELADEPRHPIRVVASRTGLSPHVIRVWELRYAAVEPARGANGYRRYTDAEVRRLRALHELTNAGHGIGDIAGLEPARLVRLLERTRAVSGPPTSLPPDASAAADRALDGPDAESELALTVMVARASLARAIRKWSAERVASVLREAAVGLPLEVFLEDILHPFLQSIGYEWEQGDVTPGQEHMVSAVVPRVLAWIAERLPAPDEEAPLAVFATPSGTRHELGALIASLVARDEGWRTLYLGPDLPAADIARGARDTRAELVAVSVVFPPHDDGIRNELADLRAALPDGVPLVAGGAAAASYAAGLPRGTFSLCGLGDLRHQLRREPEESSSRTPSS
jgi:methanogenic corrinoid protein MtbC1